MFTSRWTVAALAIAVALASGTVFTASSVLAQGTTTPPTTAPAKTGTVSGKVVDKDGKAAVGVTVIATDPNAVGRGGGGGGGGGGGAGAGGGGGGGGGVGARGAGRGRGLGGVTATTDDKGAFTLKGIPVGKVNIMATIAPADGGARQRGQTAAPVEVTEDKETKLTEDIKLADAPARGGGGGGGGGGAGRRGGGAGGGGAAGGGAAGGGGGGN